MRLVACAHVEDVRRPRDIPLVRRATVLSADKRGTQHPRPRPGERDVHDTIRVSQERHRTIGRGCAGRRNRVIGRSGIDSDARNRLPATNDLHVQRIAKMHVTRIVDRDELEREASRLLGGEANRRDGLRRPVHPRIGDRREPVGALRVQIIEVREDPAFEKGPLDVAEYEDEEIQLARLAPVGTRPPLRAQSRLAAGVLAALLVAVFAPSMLPSARQLLQSTAIAAAVAALLLVTIVLPAAYGVDPTGVGRVLGLKEMGETKAALAKDEAGPAAERVDAASPAPSTPTATAVAATLPAAAADAGKSDVTEVMLSPNEGKESKLAMRKGARVTFSWASTGGGVNYDTHGDSPTLKYHGYGKGSGAKSDEGVLTAAFEGQHGWFWRNRTTEPVTVTLRTRGDYQELKRMQ